MSSTSQAQAPSTRDPSMWLGLLQWSLRYQDGTHSSDFKPMNEEDKEWLSRFFKEQVIDEPARMHELVTILEQKNRELTATSDEDDQITDIIEELIDLTSQIDNSWNLHKIRKFESVVALLRSPNSQLREGSCSIIATCTQNHEAMQRVALEHSVVPFLAHMAVFDSNPKVRAKALFALSSTIRNFAPAEQLFITEGNGFQILIRALCDTTNVRARKYALFLTLHFVRTQPTLVKNVIETDPGVVSEILATVVNGANEHDLDVSEGVLQLLIALAESDADVAQVMVTENAIPLFQQRLERLEAHSDKNENILVEIGMLRTLVSKLTSLSTKPVIHVHQRSTATATNGATATSVASAATGTPFIATNEWQKVQSGQAVPSGLHYRMDVSTGETFAKLLDPTAPDTIPESQQSIVVVPQPQ